MILFIKTYRDHWKALIAWTLTIVGLVAIEMSIYPSIAKNATNMQSLVDAFPDAMKKIFRMQDYASGPGFLSTELYSMMVPLVIIAVAASWGASATAQEEDKGTADMLFTLPISRTSILVSKMVATISAIVALALISMVSILLLKSWAHMEISLTSLFAVTLSMIGLGLFFASLSFSVGALSSHKGAALGIATGIALISFVFYSMAGLVKTMENFSPFNPLEWALGGNPLFDGVDIAGLIKLTLSSLVFFTLTLIVFNRKDIHSQ